MRTLLLALAVLLLPHLGLTAEPRDSDRATLTGIGSFLVLVKADDAARAQGVDVDALTGEIKAKLRAAGLTVHDSVPEARLKNESDYAILVADLALGGAPDADGRVLYAAGLQVKQMATLIRDPDRRSLAVTWQVSTVGAGAAASLRPAVAELTTTFLDQYRAANAAAE